MKQNYIIAFLFGMLFTQKINFIGLVYVGEIIAFFYFLYNSQKLLFTNFEKKLIFVTLFASMLQGFVDLYHNVELVKAVKGFFSYIVFTAVVIFLCRHLKQGNSFNKSAVFFMGTIVGNFATFLYYPTYYFFTNPWKWGIGYSVLQAFLLTSLLYKKDFSKIFIIFFSIIFIYISLIYNSRSLVLIFALSLLLYLLLYNSKNNKLKFFGGKITFLFFPIIYFIIVVSLGLISANFFKATQLASFEALSEKSGTQAQGSLGVVMGARADLISAFYAIKDKPLLGHGSYPEDKNLKYRHKQYEFLHKYNYLQFAPQERFFDRYEGRPIPAHSYLFQGIVSGGILGCVFWLFLTQFFVRSYANYSGYLPLFFHHMISFYIYCLFFSPWGAPHRIRLSMFCALLILFLQLIKKRKLANEKPNEADNLLS